MGNNMKHKKRKKEQDVTAVLLLADWANCKGVDT
jgi:hypothetical protein